MDDLRQRLEQKEYDAMVANVKPAPKVSLFSDEDYSSTDAKLIKNQLSAIINILLSMVSAFVAIFIWMKNSPDYLVSNLLEEVVIDMLESFMEFVLCCCCRCK